MADVLQLEGLTRRFGDTVALRGLSFEVPAGSLYGFVGRNGAGKTTAMRIILGVLAADAGEVRWRGRTVDRAARRRFGYMPEERGLYPTMRVLDQLVHLARLHGVGAGEARRASEALLERLGLGERAGDRTESLSLGNQQRVQLAAALVHEPELLVLDEPFSGLDPVGVDVLAEVLIERVRAGVAVLFSSHQLELVERLCDAVAIIEGGRLVASGPVAALRERGARPRWVVELDAAPVAWAQRLPGTVVEAGDGRALVELDAGDDAQELLRAAQAVGDVRRFAPVEPTLAELFRDVVVETEGDSELARAAAGSAA
jgi:ABC-2 type transport system ATP-binding protein